MTLKQILIFALFLACIRCGDAGGKGDLPLCTDPAIKSQACANNDTYCGDWKINKRVYVPNNCHYRRINNADARKCVANRTIACIGDSIIRDMCVGLALYLSGEKVEEGLDYKFDRKAEISNHFTNATKIGDFKSWTLNKDNYNGLLFPKVDENHKTDWQWQVQVWELHANRYLHNHHVEDVLMNKMVHENPLLRPIDFAFWGHGLHDYGWWDSHPFGQRFFDTIVKQWIRVRDTVPTPVVWTSINPHCLALDPLAKRSFFERKPGGFEKQTHMAQEANFVTREALESFQLTFMELDAECRGALDLDELKLLMVMMGEKMDKEEIKELLDEYDLDHSGNLDFKEFVLMMKGWNTRFGTGWRKIFNEKTKRGAIGKSRRAWSRWWNQDKLEEAQVQAAKQRMQESKQVGRDLELKYLSHEQMKLARENELHLRAEGFSFSPNYIEPEPNDYYAGTQVVAQGGPKTVKFPPINQQRKYSTISDITSHSGGR